MNKKAHRHFYLIFMGIVACTAVFVLWQLMKTPSNTGNWVTEKIRLSSADFNGDLVTVKNVRNFRYNGSEDDKDITINYYDKTYDLNQLKKVWYITEPFPGLSIAAHTFLSFEFSNGDFLSISIEAREKKGQVYGIFSGLLNTYPLMYIAGDERDMVFVRANIRKSELYAYPVKLSKPENARLLLVDMLKTMNDLVLHPRWYNTLTANCTSLIAYHVNRISPHRLPPVSWQEVLTGYADELALKKGLLDTDLPLDQARTKYYITKRSQEIGDVDNYSILIRQFDKK